MNSFDPTNPGVDSHPLVDAVLGLLEEAGIPTETNDKIVALIEAELAKQVHEDIPEGFVDEPSELDIPSGGADPLYGLRMDSADMGEEPPYDETEDS